MTTPARKPTLQVMAYIGREVDALDAGFNAPMPFGCMPAGASPSMVTVQFTTPVVTASGNPFTLSIGTKNDPQRWYSDTIMSGAQDRIDVPIDQTKTRPMSKDSECFIEIDTPSGRPPLEGHLIAYLTFIPLPLMRDATSPWS